MGFTIAMVREIEEAIRLYNFQMLCETIEAEIGNCISNDNIGYVNYCREQAGLPSLS